VVLIALVGVSAPFNAMPAQNKRVINEVNGKLSSSWSAGFNENFDGKTIGDVKNLLGWVPNPKVKDAMPVQTAVAPDLPVEFNSTENWPTCQTIGTIYNQAECGSCWAFGCVEAASDRACIHLGKTNNYVLSFMEQTACNENCDGCEGGDPYSAFNFVAESGLVSGDCYPYDIPTCPPEDQPCLNFVNTPNCQSQCNNTDTWSPLVFNSSYAVEGEASVIQTEIMTNGPVEACFSVYEDFLSYKSGVYTYQTGSYLGGHCIKIIGWGVEGTVPYWLCNNSWTTSWGDNGIFKIKRGVDECGIEDEVAAGLPANAGSSDSIKIIAKPIPRIYLA